MIPPAVARELLERILAGEARTKADLQRLKLEACRRHRFGKIPSDPDLLAFARPEERARLVPFLRIKPTRSLSGVAIVTVQSSPIFCPHGTCTFCPGGPTRGTAQSYTGHEPAALRAAQHGFDARGQVENRLHALHATGHPVDKVDAIIQGGTFPARDEAYQVAFVAGMLEAMNDFSPDDDVGRRDRALGRGAGNGNGSGGEDGSGSGTGGGLDAWARLRAAQDANEVAAARMIGLTIETKPDWALPRHCDLMLDLGATRVEIGAQTLFDDVLAATNRGHTVADTVASFRAAKDAGLKLCAHVMPGLPGSDAARDLATFRGLFEDPAFRPDMLKVYPTLVVPGTALHRAWQRGEFRPLGDAEAAEIVAEAKALVPPWCRIQRVDRDIPTPQIAAGVKRTNLRELATEALARRGGRCRCLRCREAGHAARREGWSAGDGAWEATATRYEASGGEEWFLAREDRARDAVA
ncbi:MAG TPA: elongator complex protein 3, partial [Candidatus Thermoplasmatota archaeon]|nr:elongator complex protein 3 [Candidatus Thermoplasmatota archaeon]